MRELEIKAVAELVSLKGQVRYTGPGSAELKKVVDHIIEHGAAEIYAQTGEGLDNPSDITFWYKVLFFPRKTHLSALNCDTCGAYVLPRSRARTLVKWEELTEVTIEQVFENWGKYGLWTGRNVEHLLMAGAVK